MQIEGKVAVVTGAASGIGRACALAFGAAGATVVVADLDEGGAKETAGLIEAAGGAASVVCVDVTDVAAVGALFAGVEAEHGGIDIVHNNAGMVCGEPLFPATSVERMLDVMSVNLGGVVIGTRLALDPLRRRGGGAIVNTASLAALFPLADDPIYSATKAGVAMWTRACARLAETDNIRVNAVLPALIDTPLLAKSGDGTRPAPWVGEAEALIGLLPATDVADAVLDLVRDDTLAGECRTVGGVPGGPAS